jgi:hypothetical protein
VNIRRLGWQFCWQAGNPVPPFARWSPIQLDAFFM